MKSSQNDQIVELKQLRINEIRERQVRILISVADFCNKNNLRYFLCGGTLLGSIRHKGYIPWDDDIDISMPRPDYEKFIATYHNEQYEIMTCSSDNEYLGLFTKVYDNETLLKENGEFGENVGLNIDIFPVDGLPNSDFMTKTHILWMKFLQGLIVSTVTNDISNKPLNRRIQINTMRLLLKMIKNKHNISLFAIKQAQKYPFDTSNRVAVVVWGYGKKEIVDKIVAVDYIEGEFENLKFNIPKLYDVYLSNLYGDYMQLPPEHDRVSKHNMIVYLLQK